MNLSPRLLYPEDCLWPADHAHQKPRQVRDYHLFLTKLFFAADFFAATFPARLFTAATLTARFLTACFFMAEALAGAFFAEPFFALAADAASRDINAVSMGEPSPVQASQNGREIELPRTSTLSLPRTSASIGCTIVLLHDESDGGGMGQGARSCSHGDGVGLRLATAASTASTATDQHAHSTHACEHYCDQRKPAQPLPQTPLVTLTAADVPDAAL